MMGYRRLFIMRKDLHMSTGKLMAQISHCAEAYWTRLIKKDIFEQYLEGSFVKTICEARNKNHLLKAKTISEDMGLKEGEDFGLIFDKCWTELIPEEEDGTTLTGIWFRPLPDDVSHEISRKYHLYMG